MSSFLGTWLIMLTYYSLNIRGIKKCTFNRWKLKGKSFYLTLATLCSLEHIFNQSLYINHIIKISE